MMLILDDVSEHRCKEAFINHSEDSCILYDDDRCDGEEGLKAMKNGASLMNVVKLVDFDVESVSVRKGCQLTVYTGNVRF